MKKSKKPRITKALLRARQMPPLPHSVPQQPFDITKSQAAKWLINQPEIINTVFQHYKDQGAITYDPDSQTWSGTENKPRNL